MKEIEGTYSFGESPPKHLMGWLEEQVLEAREECESAEEPFKVIGKPPPCPPPPIWTLTKKINNGKHLPTLEQAIGDCVAFGVAQAGARLQVAEIVSLHQAELLKPWYPPFIYGISRVQVGGGQIDGDGSTGAWGATAVNEYGILFNDDDDVPPYSGEIARSWGRTPGPPAKHIYTAESRPVETISRLTTIAQIRDALCNYYPVTIASSRGFRMKPVDREGFHVFVPEGTWMHQMSLIAWMDEPFQAAYRLNSWGPDAHGTPLNDEPPGGAWCTVECLADELRNRYTEVYSYAAFEGYPSALRRGLIREREPLPPIGGNVI